MLEAENFPFLQVSDYLVEPDCLVRADLLQPDEETLCQLAEELSVGRVSAFSTKQGFVTVRLDGAVDIDAVVRRWDDNADLLRFGKDWL